MGFENVDFAPGLLYFGNVKTPVQKVTNIIHLAGFGCALLILGLDTMTSSLQAGTRAAAAERTGKDSDWGIPIGDRLVYKKVGDTELHLSVVKPANWKSGDKRAAIVFFHGGGWVGGPRGQFNEQAKYFASRGLVCAQVEYRFATKSDAPTVCCQDAKSAMRWVRSHAKELGINPNRIISSGGSAGGHLAAFVAMVDGLDDPTDDKSVSCKPCAMVLFNPVFDNGPGGYGHDRIGDRYKEFSPTHNIKKGSAPAVVFLGTNDKLIPVKTVEDFKAKMLEAGSKCEAFFYDGQAHGFFNQEPWRTKAMIEADKFLASLGLLNGPPTLKE